MGVLASVTPRTTDINIVDISKGVSHTNETVLQVVDLSETPSNTEIFAVLVATGMHDGAYQVGGQARLEFRSATTWWLFPFFQDIGEVVYHRWQTTRTARQNEWVHFMY